MQDPPHPIIDQPWRWAITAIVWGSDEITSLPYIDVTFQRDDQSKTLRFEQPTYVKVEFDGSFPIHGGEMAILDIRGRGWQDITVQVTEFGASGSPLKFYARSVRQLLAIDG